jgi:hypothetical protein
MSADEPARTIAMTRSEIWFPRRFAAWGLHRSLRGAILGIAIAMGFSTLAAYRLSTTTRVDELIFGPGRSDAVDLFIQAIGVDRTAVLVYMLQRSFDALVVASAITPLFLWALGSSAMHAAARIRGVRGRPYLPIVILFAYATVVYQVPTSTAGLVFGAFGSGPGPQLASAVSIAALVWFALVVYRGIELHYAVSGDRALAIFALGAIAFYFIPLLLIVAALVAIVLAAALLQYF